MFQGSSNESTQPIYIFLVQEMGTASSHLIQVPPPRTIANHMSHYCWRAAVMRSSHGLMGIKHYLFSVIKV